MSPMSSEARGGTRIVATVGPASNRESVLASMIRAGADVFRFNMSHGTHEEHAEIMARVRRAARRLGRNIGILVDLSGPKLRTGLNQGGGLVPLRRGELVSLAFRDRRREGGGSRLGRIVIDQPALAHALGPGDDLLLDDGRFRLQVTRRSRGECQARVLRGGALKEHAGVNVPGRLLSLRLPTRKDAEDAAFALEQGADFLALSFVQSPEDIHRVRKLVSRLLDGAGRAVPRRRSDLKAGTRPGATPRATPLLIAKLEKPAALEHLDAIIGASDGVMVARGDLGVELALERVPFWQKEILRRARARGIITITATQMLESMIRNPVPTRAEISDAANAVLDGTDALMLSAESAAGDYPVESVRVLARVAEETDPAWFHRGLEPIEEDAGLQMFRGDPTETGHPDPEDRETGDDPVCAVTWAAVEMAVRAAARRIVVFTLTGRTARLIARHRPPMPILALTPRAETRRQLSLAWNTRAFLLPHARGVEEMMRRGLRLIAYERQVRSGDLVVLVAGDRHPAGATNMLRLAIM